MQQEKWSRKNLHYKWLPWLRICMYTSLLVDRLAKNLELNGLWKWNCTIIARFWFPYLIFFLLLPAVSWCHEPGCKSPCLVRFVLFFWKNSSQASHPSPIYSESSLLMRMRIPFADVPIRLSHLGRQRASERLKWSTAKSRHIFSSSSCRRVGWTRWWLSCLHLCYP